MESRGDLPALPPVAHRHIVAWWLEIGPTQAGAMSEGPVSWQEIAAWERLNGIEMTAFEAKAIRRMSSAFVSQRHDARKSGCPAPYSEELPKAVQDKVTSQFAAMIAAMKGCSGS